VQLGTLRTRRFALGLASLRGRFLLATALGFLTLAGFGLATRLFLGENARLFVGATSKPGAASFS
jgi:hypothetical protein